MHKEKSMLKEGWQIWIQYYHSGDTVAGWHHGVNLRLHEVTVDTELWQILCDTRFTFFFMSYIVYDFNL